MVAVLVEYIRSLNEYNIAVQVSTSDQSSVLTSHLLCKN